MSTLRQNDQTSDILLDFIAGGESGGNFNAVIGSAHSTNDLGQLDLAGIYVLMANLLHKGEPSTAIGRYQFIRATLQSLAKALPLDTKFTPALQDQLAIDLLNTACHYQNWRRGTISDEGFAHLLSCQWASLPDPQNGGKSHYDHVGPNHAGTSLAAVYAMLVRAKAALRGAGAGVPRPQVVAPPVLPVHDAPPPTNLAPPDVITGPILNDVGRVGAPAQPHTIPAPTPTKTAPPPRPAPPHDDDAEITELTREANPGVSIP